VAVLIGGETGVGKEMIARLIHICSGKTGPFKAVNSAGLPETLVDSELFGHKKGAFTGAIDDHIGCFEQASGGTLFLDEVSDMSAVAQAKILRATDREGVYSPVGSRRELRTDCRLISATNRPMEKLIEEGRFRQDLFYRLSGFCINIPSLRERPGDVLLLAQNFLTTACQTFGKNLTFSSDALEFICAYVWPGNVRELKNAVERAAALCPHPRRILQAGDFRLNGSSNGDLAENIKLSPFALKKREIYIEALKANRWIQTHAAKQLGITRRILAYAMEKLGIRSPFEELEEGYLRPCKKKSASANESKPEAAASPTLPSQESNKKKREALSAPVSANKTASADKRKRHTKKSLIGALEANGWNQKETAKALKTNQTYVSYLMNKWEIEKPGGSGKLKKQANRDARQTKYSDEKLQAIFEACGWSQSLSAKMIGVKVHYVSIMAESRGIVPSGGHWRK